MATPPRELTATEMLDLLAELGARLQARGVEAQLYLVGGAAIAFSFDTRRVTADIDAIFHPETTVKEEAEAMAEDHDLPRNWWNSNARAFLPGADDDAVSLAVPGLSVSVASPEHLLAMKMASYRPGKDQADLELLFHTLAIASAQEAADLALRISGEHTVVLPERDELILSAEAILDRMSGGGG